MTATSSDPAVATVTGPVVVHAGDWIAELQISTGTAGTARLRLEASGIRFEFNVEVGATPAAGATPVIVAAGIGVTVMADPTLGRVIVSPAAAVAANIGIRLLATPSATDVQVVVSSSNPAVATVGGGEKYDRDDPCWPTGIRSVIATAGTEGAAILTFEFGGQRRQLTIVVGNPPANQIPAATAPIVGVRVQQP